METLQKLARAMAHEGKPVTWVTPLGFPWVNRYHVTAEKAVDLWLHDKRVQITVADGHTKTIDKDKSANGVAPNFVHACDATHLLMVAKASTEEGITIATIHDSFGCLASRAGRFHQIIREQFVRLYEEHDVLSEVL
jgi:DNA-directed RNA polymerase